MIDFQMLEKALYGYVPTDTSYIDKLFDSMRYSLQAGGKRVRPRLVLEFAELCSGSAEAAVPFACAVEYIHTYSLIHDDLPCMDDDDMRRGKASNHIVFGEDTALLAGDALQSLAFEVMSLPESVSGVGADNAVRCISKLAHYCGGLGMVGGQIIDLENETKTASYDEIAVCDDLKTGGLIKAACAMGVICAGGEESLVKAAEQYGKCIGIAFQIVDDILDVTSTDEQLGKPVGSDEDNNKSTYVSLYGLDWCRKRVDELTDEAIAALSAFEGDTLVLADFARSLAGRKN